jgi:hypothetical protein
MLQYKYYINIQCSVINLVKEISTYLKINNENVQHYESALISYHGISALHPITTKFPQEKMAIYLILYSII